MRTVSVSKRKRAKTPLKVKGFAFLLLLCVVHPVLFITLPSYFTGNLGVFFGFSEWLLPVSGGATILYGFLGAVSWPWTLTITYCIIVLAEKLPWFADVETKDYILVGFPLVFVLSNIVLMLILFMIFSF